MCNLFSKWIIRAHLLFPTIWYVQRHHLWRHNAVHWRHATSLHCSDVIVLRTFRCYSHSLLPVVNCELFDVLYEILRLIFDCGLRYSAAQLQRCDRETCCLLLKDPEKNRQFELRSEDKITRANILNSVISHNLLTINPLHYFKFHKTIHLRGLYLGGASISLCSEIKRYTIQFT